MEIHFLHQFLHVQQKKIFISNIHISSIHNSCWKHSYSDFLEVNQVLPAWDHKSNTDQIFFQEFPPQDPTGPDRSQLRALYWCESSLYITVYLIQHFHILLSYTTLFSRCMLSPKVDKVFPYEKEKQRIQATVSRGQNVCDDRGLSQGFNIIAGLSVTVVFNVHLRLQK